MRIGVNALYLLPGRVGGTESYLRSLLAALAEIDSVNEYFVFANRETSSSLIPPVSNFHFVNCGVLAAFRPFRLFWEQAVLPAQLRAKKIDVLFNPGFTAPAMAPCPSVTVFHDLQHKVHPEFFRWLDLPFWNLFLRLSAAVSARLIAVSEATAADLRRFFPDLSEKITVIHHGVDEEFRRIAQRRQPEKMLLMVSTLHPHKNIGRLLEAFCLFRRMHPDHRLVVVGLRGFAAEELAAQARKLALTSCVSFPGWIPRAELFSLFERCSALIAPSLFEGFGLPILEALAAGIPVACSDIPVFREVAGDAAIYFDPFSPVAIAEAMARVVDEPALRALAQTTGPARAAQFDWLDCAAGLRAIMSGLVQQKGSPPEGESPRSARC